MVVLANLATRLRAAEHVSPDVALEALERAAAREGKALDDVRRAIDMVCSGEAVPENLQAVPTPVQIAPLQAQPAPPPVADRLRTRPRGGPTFRELSRRWTSGELAREHPDHVQMTCSAEDDACVGEAAALT